ncbi:MAG: hypothetical protein OXN89_09655 [Bryobacterales bacterium]|nr:hypothetical protein [Bryobacterales bacterium]
MPPFVSQPLARIEPRAPGQWDRYRIPPGLPDTVDRTHHRLDGRNREAMRIGLVLRHPAVPSRKATATGRSDLLQSV